MQLLHTEALVLRALDFGESDRIVRLLTPDRGRVTAIAKGAKRSQRRFPGTLDILNWLEVQIAPRRSAAGMVRLEHSRLKQAFEPLRAHTGRFAMSCYLIELLDRLAPEGGLPRDLTKLFTFAVDALTLIVRTKPDERLRTLLELRALAALGLCPEFRCCVRCGKEVETNGAVDFHVADGGLVCASCPRTADAPIAVHLGTLRLLEQSLHFEFSQLDRLVFQEHALREATLIVRRFEKFHLGVELRSDRFLREALQSESSKPFA